jgi:hypothetical protein
MLAAASGRWVMVSGGATGTSLCAALLTLPALAEVPCLVEAAHVQGVAAARLAANAARWREREDAAQDLPGSTSR